MDRPVEDPGPVEDFDDGDPDHDPAEWERAWEVEIQRRLDEYRSGAVQPIPSSEVFAKARAMLRRDDES